MLGIIIVPGDGVVIQKSKEVSPVLFQAFLALQGGFGVIVLLSQAFEKGNVCRDRVRARRIFRFSGCLLK